MWFLIKGLRQVLNRPCIVFRDSAIILYLGVATPELALLLTLRRYGKYSLRSCQKTNPRHGKSRGRGLKRSMRRPHRLLLTCHARLNDVALPA